MSKYKLNYTPIRAFLYYILLSILINSYFDSITFSYGNIRKEKNGVPKLVLDKDAYDFGVIKPNSNNIAIFNLTNIGNKTLIIKDIKKCCGAVIKLDKDQIAPGEKAVLSAEYYSGTGSGLLKRTIGFTTNEPNNPHITLTITGQLTESLQVLPEKLIIYSFNNATECEDIKIKSLDNTKFSVVNIASTNQCFITDYDPNCVATEIVLKPKIKLDKLRGLDGNNGSIIMELNHPNYKTISLSFDVIPSVQVIPEQIFVMNAKYDKPIIKSMELRDNQNQNNKDIYEQIDSITSESGCKIEIQKDDAIKGSVKLRLKLWPVKANNKGYFLKDQIVIKLKDGRTLNVPMRIFYATQTLTSKAN